MGSMILMSQFRRTEDDRRVLYKDYIVNVLTRRELRANKSETDQVLEILNKQKHDNP